MSGAKEVCKKDFEVRNKYGMHARPAALFVKTASKFSCEITVRRDDVEVSGKSIMGLLTIEGYCGATLTVVTEGADASEAMEALAVLFENSFYEE